MKHEVQLFTSQHKSFTFCDFDWKPTSFLSDQPDSEKRDIFFLKYNQIYVWECGLHSGKKIIESYLYYKEEFTEHITFRDSSFILYDSANDTIIAARDFMGNYPLYYFALPEENVFTFSFSMNALLASRLFIPAINYSKIIEYIACNIHALPNNQTFYQHVYRLLPAYVLCIKQDTINDFKRYGKFDLTKYQSFTDTEYIERFQQLFIESVQKNTDSFKKIAATLSGGLDSSAVCSVAQSLRNEPIHTFNFATQTAKAHENEFIEAVVNQWHTIHQTVEPGCSNYEAIRKLTELNGQPCFVFNYTIQLDLIEAAKQNNCDIFLSGHWGDQVVNYGTQYIQELVDKEEWAKAKMAIKQSFDYSLSVVKSAGSNSKKDKKKSARLYALRLLLGKEKRKQSWSNIPQTLWILYKEFDCRLEDLFTIFSQKIRHTKQITPPKIDKLIRPETLAECTRMKALYPPETLDISTTINAPISNAQKQHLNVIFKGNQTYGQEEYFEIYRQNSLRSAQPFFDADLIELSLSIPLRIKFDDGRKRGTLRKALTDYLPEKIVNRTTKAIFTDHYLHLFISLYADFEAHTPSDHPIWQIVNRTTFEENVKIVLNDQHHVHQKQVVMPPLVRIIHLAVWLDYTEQQKK
ncbi:asparagine synthase-related protein [Spirosoma validum]|uniref:asparagine synthase (glutamine-hydrolyzing) n=1 Tax=Spirosoma validum TaxID=2771355 RepID=A0A927GCE6_9BACT|nr:asparagine synthetase B family protein [Spirosoma validum]MBD2752440.1 hypothetical protein [Spirosoma validum]